MSTKEIPAATSLRSEDIENLHQQRLRIEQQLAQLTTQLEVLAKREPTSKESTSDSDSDPEGPTLVDIFDETLRDEKSETTFKESTTTADKESKIKGDEHPVAEKPKREISEEARALIDEVRNLTPPRIRILKTVKVTAEDIHESMERVWKSKQQGMEDLQRPRMTRGPKSLHRLRRTIEAPLLCRLPNSFGTNVKRHDPQTCRSPRPETRSEKGTPRDADLRYASRESAVLIVDRPITISARASCHTVQGFAMSAEQTDLTPTIVSIQMEANRVQQFLIRENALEAVEDIDNPAAKYAIQISQEKWLQALKAPQSPATGRTLGEVLREQPELNEGQEVKIIIPSIYKKRQKKST
ncbi:hypothetical protein KPH14_000897 [Odynerus spinipes]|uniref:Uncharacterized protein n=1 Tax=Odynerus spinipes TaxID=1348599 RepID=A0AAD9RCA8_9HYME|nr:hypothetical protein KPH14_000897 [Odynerus spinipes]